MPTGISEGFIFCRVDILGAAWEGVCSTRNQYPIAVVGVWLHFDSLSTLKVYIPGLYDRATA